MITPTPKASTAPTPTVYLGTGGYSDSDMLGTLYPIGTKKTDFLAEYAKHYGAVEINSSFYAPLGHKAYEGMLRKSDGKVKFAIKLHQDFSHTLKATAEHAIAFIQALQPLIETDRLAPLLIQFPHGFDRTKAHRLYLAKLADWFSDYPLAIEFRHASWHIPQVEHSFQQFGLIWCSVDYPQVNGLPNSRLLFTQGTGQNAHQNSSSQNSDSQSNSQTKSLAQQTRTGYLRMHGNNLNWWDALSASERHDYRYTPQEMQGWAQAIANQRQHFDELYVFFQNTTKAHAYYNIAMLRQSLIDLGFQVL
ncbi:DUF72 domain-containing protein [Psychrobacter phenylpyruvicus]|uniref:Protein of uncharacterized function DUF72 n=1 Tax=Psychrobacter phenylpyruvicus TaxID=29432 RepID=A0A379LPJ2_9GAMM|nr:DUF72 domain-containing protein [Psychrobacter phenylpyruvicus]SUD91722.1 Protein of uncharacterised function DUF72 [Psychrobacter phenylpyruvicus]